MLNNDSDTNLRGRALFQGRISFSFQDITQKHHCGYPLGSIWTFWDPNEIGTPNYFYRSGIAAFMEVIFFRSKILTKKAILAAH